MFCPVTFITLYRVIKPTKNSISHDIIEQDESQWQVVLVAAGLLQVLHNLDHTLKALAALGNVDWRLIYFPVGYIKYCKCRFDEILYYIYF